MTDVLQTRITIKPGGIAIIAGVAVLLVAAAAIGFRGSAGSAGTAAGTARTTAGTTSLKPGAARTATTSSALLEDIPASLAGAELADRKLLIQLNSTPNQQHDWLFLGALPTGVKDPLNAQESLTQMSRILDTSYLPSEVKYQAKENATITVRGKNYKWRKLTGSAFDFKQMYLEPGKPDDSLSGVIVYGYTTIESKTAAKKVLHFRSDDGAIVWLNGERVFKVTKLRGVADAEDVIPVTLRAGKNSVLVKVGQATNGWGMSFLMEDVS